MRARVDEILHCDHCGGLIVGPRDYDVALCHCARPKSEGKVVARGKLARRSSRFDGRHELNEPAQPERLEEPIRALSWDALPPPEK